MIVGALFHVFFLMLSCFALHKPSNSGTLVHPLKEPLVMGWFKLWNVNQLQHAAYEIYVDDFVLQISVISWAYPPPGNSHHQDYYNF